MTEAQRVQLLARDNGAGLSRDLALMQHVFALTGAQVKVGRLKRRGVGARLWTRIAQLGKSPHFDLNVMFERIRPEYLPQARTNVLIPNPEYLDRQTLQHLHRIDALWCKTNHAVQLFQSMGVFATYLGFASSDRWLPNVKRQDAFFHGPGRSNTKGTRALIALWRAHPNWPILTIVWRRKHVDLSPLPPNIRLIQDHVDDDTYRHMQNQYRFHLCPSETEGFGHYIVEAMSCGAIVLTLDAAPMNELVSAERGIIAPARRLSHQGLAVTWGLEPKTFSQAIEACLSLSQQDKEILGHRARTWFLTRMPSLIEATTMQLSSVTHESNP